MFLSLPRISFIGLLCYTLFVALKYLHETPPNFCTPCIPRPGKQNNSTCGEYSLIYWVVLNAFCFVNGPFVQWVAYWFLRWSSFSLVLSLICTLMQRGISEESRLYSCSVGCCKTVELVRRVTICKPRGGLEQPVYYLCNCWKNKGKLFDYIALEFQYVGLDSICFTILNLIT